MFDEPSEANSHIHGLSISGGGILDVDVRGVAINGVASYVNKADGIHFSGLFSMSYCFRGLVFGAIRNKSTYGKGIQIGLINTVREGNLVQIGLINRIGRRTLPFINFNFKKKRES